MIKPKKKIAVITGGSKGIGFACAEKLAKEGYSIAICSRTTKDLILKSKLIEKKYNVKCIYGQVDASKVSDVEKFTSFVINEFKNIDVLINNCGIQLNKK